MRNNGTSHLTADLAQLHDSLQALRAEVAWRCLNEVRPGDPGRAELRASAEGLDADLKTLRDPEATGEDLEWVRSMWDGVPTSYDAWTAAPAAEADTTAPAPDTWTVTPAAEADAPEVELEAA
jgi:hypothetical protein